MDTPSGLRGVIFAPFAEVSMIEPQLKRASFFVDGQNLFYAVKKAFGYTYPNYDVKKLAENICGLKKGEISEVHFYTGIPDRTSDAEKNRFWTAKLAMTGRHEVKTFSRKLSRGREKGIDVRIAIDVLREIFEDTCNIAVILSQDQDLSEVAKEVRYISKRENRWIKIASAFPVSPTLRNKQGIKMTDWIKIDREMYDSCIDTRDYRPKSGGKNNAS